MELLTSIRMRSFSGNFVQLLYLFLVFNVAIRTVNCNGIRPSTFSEKQNLYGQNQGFFDSLRNVGDTITGTLNWVWEGLRFSDSVNSKIESGSSFDFIVVGAGTAGATIAARLSEIPEVSVLLIEAGGDEYDYMDIPLAANLLQFNPDLNWQYKTESSNSYCLGMNNRQCQWPRGRVMGGSSVLNYMIATRGNKKDYDRWSEMGSSGWSWNEVLPYFKKLESIGINAYQNDSEFHNINGPVRTEYVPFRSPIATAFVQAGLELGWNEVDYNGKQQAGFSFIQTTTRNGTRFSSNKAYIKSAGRRKNLFIAKRCHVTKVVMDEEKKQATGVEFLKNGEVLQVQVRKEVIISAGTINSPQILMTSGIGPKTHLEEMGIRVIKDSPVGENLQDHIAFGGLVFTLEQPVGIAIDEMLNPLNSYIRDFMLDKKGPLTIPGGVEGIAFIDVDNPDDSKDYPNIELLFVSASIGTASIFERNLGLDPEFWSKSFSNINTTFSWTIFPMLLRPKSRGKILLREVDPGVHPKIIPNYMSHPDDVRLLIKGIRYAIKVGNTKSMRSYGSKLHTTPIRGCEKYTFDSDKYWDCALRTLTMNIYHYSGTCKMGAESDPTAVVNPRLKVIGVQNLRVADASIMPEIPSGHINIPTYMIGEKLADMVKEDWGYPIRPLE